MQRNNYIIIMSFLVMFGKCRLPRTLLSPTSVTSQKMLYKGVVETSPKRMWHSHDFDGRSKTNPDMTSHNVTLHYYVLGITMCTYMRRLVCRHDQTRLCFSQLSFVFNIALAHLCTSLACSCTVYCFSDDWAEALYRLLNVF